MRFPANMAETEYDGEDYLMVGRDAEGEPLKIKLKDAIGHQFIDYIKPTDAAPTPARNGNYTFSIGGNKPAWLTAEAGITEVKAGDGVSVVYDGVSAYTYTHVDVSSEFVTMQKLAEFGNKLFVNNHYFDGFFLRKDTTYTIPGDPLINSFVDAQTPFGKTYLHIKINTPTSNDKLMIGRSFSRTFNVGEKWTFAYISRAFDGGALYRWCYTNISGSSVEMYEPTRSTDLGNGWYLVEFDITVAIQISNPFAYVELKNDVTTEAFIAGVYLTRDMSQQKYNLVLQSEKDLVSDVSTVRETVTSINNRIYDDKNIVYDPLLINGINNLDRSPLTSSVVAVSTPYGEGNAIKITAATNESVRYKFDNIFALNDILKIRWLIKCDVNQATGWGIVYYEGGFSQDYAITKTVLSDGWELWQSLYTINSTMAASSYISGGYFTQNMNGNSQILITGFEVIALDSNYNEIVLPKTVKKLISDSEYFRSKVVLIPEPQPKIISCSGDSLTSFSYTTPIGTKYYTTFLQDLVGTTNYLVKNFGVGGENTSQIITRQGGKQLSVNDNAGITIPATTTAVQLTLNVANLLLQGAGHDSSINPCYIRGISGSLSLSGGIYYFTRTTAGNQLFVPKSTPIFTNQQLNFRSGIMVLGTGTNDAKSTPEERQATIDNIKRFVEYSRAEDYIIVLPHSSSADYMTLTDLMKSEFGGRCVDIRNLFTHEGVKLAIDNGYIQDAINNAGYAGSDAYKHITSYSNLNRIVFTSPDSQYLTDPTVLDDIANGRVPSIFMTDGTHFNLIGMKLQAYFVNEALRLLSLVK